MSLTIEDSNITREKLLEVTDFSDETKKNIEKSDILVVPRFQFRESNSRVFYASTPDFYKLAQNELRNGTTIALCENQGEEKTLTLRSGEIWIPILLISIDPIKDVLLPSLISLVTNYISSKFSRETKKDSLKVHLEIIVEDKNTKKSKALKYEGPVSGLKDLNINAKSLFEER